MLDSRCLCSSVMCSSFEERELEWGRERKKLASLDHCSLIPRPR